MQPGNSATSLACAQNRFGIKPNKVVNGIFGDWLAVYTIWMMFVYFVSVFNSLLLENSTLVSNFTFPIKKVRIDPYTFAVLHFGDASEFNKSQQNNPTLWAATEFFHWWWGGIVKADDESAQCYVLNGDRQLNGCIPWFQRAARDPHLDT